MATRKKKFGDPRPFEEVAASYDHMVELNKRPAVDTPARIAFERLKDDPVIATLAAHATAFRDWARNAACRITDDETLRGATAAIEQAKTCRDGVEKHRKAIVEEPKRHLKNVDAKFAEVRKPYDEAINLLQFACGEFVRSRQLAAAAAFTASAAALDNGDVATATANLEQYNALQVNPSKGTLKTEYEVLVINSAIVPREWLTVDTAKLCAAKAADPSLVVMGVQFTESTRLTVTKPRTPKATDNDQEE